MAFGMLACKLNFNGHQSLTAALGRKMLKLPSAGLQVKRTEQRAGLIQGHLYLLETVTNRKQACGHPSVQQPTISAGTAQNSPQ
jgi:hypothetical protein